MEDVEDVAPAVEQALRFRNGRWDIMYALAALSDPEYQQSHWLGERTERTDDWDNLDDVVYTLFDHWSVLSDDPGEWVGYTLLHGPEVDRLRRLAGVLNPLIERRGDVDDAAYVHDSSWALVQRLAASALAAMVLVVPGGLAPVPGEPASDIPVKGTDASLMEGTAAPDRRT